MSDKDDFAFFDEEEEPSTTDLKSLFEEGEEHAPHEDARSHSQKADERLQAREPDPPPPPPGRKNRAGGSSRSRILLLVLLLVVICGAGAFYFMELGETPPEPVKKTKGNNTVAVPPKPAAAKVPAAETATEPAESKTVVVPPPVPDKEVVKPATGEPPPAQVVETPVAAQATAESVPEQSAAQSSGQVRPTDKSAVTVSKPKATAASEIGGRSYTLDAGSYLLDANRSTLERRLRQLDYRPRISQVEAQVAMTRLRLGAFSESEARQTLNRVRGIAPGAFSLPRDGQQVVYAGTFVDQDNISKIKARLAQEGFVVETEPVTVSRTLSRVCFGDFATVEQAEKEAARLADAGLKVTVVQNP